MRIERDTGASDSDPVVLTLKGQFEAFSLPTFSAEIEGLIDAGRLRICLDLKHLTFITSTALGYLVSAGKRLAELEGKLVFSEPSRFFRDTARTLELHQLFEIFDRTDDALRHLSAMPG